MKKWSLLLFILISTMSITCATKMVAHGQPRISNCGISPDEIGYQTKMTISFDYENVKGGLKNAKIVLLQEFQVDEQQELVTRTSDWQAYLEDLSAYPSESGRFVITYVNTDMWTGPVIELTYKFKIVDKNGNESNFCTTKIMPR